MTKQLNTKNICYRLAIKEYEKACNDLVSIINRDLFDNSRSPYWIGDVVGSSCDFEEADVLTPDDMVLILANDMDYDQYAEWRDSNIDHAGEGYINLKSWLMGLRHDMLNK